MKSFIAFTFAALLVSVLCDPPAEWLESSKQCAAEQKVILDDIKKVMTGEIKPTDVTGSMKCYFACLTEKEGLTKDGVFQPTVVQAKLVGKDANTIAGCNVKGIDKCDTSFKIMTCFVQNKLI